MNRFTLALALLLHAGWQSSAYQATPNDALMASFVAGEGNNEANNMLGEESIGSELKDMFVAWTEKFGKEYESLEEMADRMLIWVKNHALIENHNNQEPAPSYTLGHNHFSDLTQEEFRQMHFLGEFATEFDIQKAKVQDKFPKPTDTEVTERRALRHKKKLPKEVNWVEAGAVTEVKNQGHCGGCWSFSTTGSIEGARFIKTGELEPLSEQMLIDCDTRVDKGCQGGLMDNAFKFDEGVTGICSEEDYPYEAVDGQCRMQSCDPVPDTALKSFVDVDDMDAEALMSAVSIGPVSVAVQASQMAFQFYRKGVFAEASCGKPEYPMCKEGDEDDYDCCTDAQKFDQSCFPKVDHAVLVVGYGEDEQTGKPYWLVKNSWGTTWGDKGYIRVSREEVEDNDWGVCGIMSLPSYPVLK